MVREVNGPSASLVKNVGRGDSNADKTNGIPPVEGGANRIVEAVSLTDLAAKLQRLAESIADIPVVDQEKVESFGHAVADGSYELDTEAIAEKLAIFETLLETIRRSA